MNRKFDGFHFKNVQHFPPIQTEIFMDYFVSYCVLIIKIANDDLEKTIFSKQIKK